MDNKGLERSYVEYDFYWNKFCEQFLEGALYEKCHKMLVGVWDKELGIKSKHDENFVEVYNLSLNKEELKLLNIWFFDGIKFVLNSENLFIITNIELTGNDIFNLIFTRIKE